MPAGTIALTNNSTTVTGTGTSFTSELKVNDFVVAVVGGVAYTLGVTAIASNTSLTLIQKYDGPTTSGLTWNPVPFGTMTAITAQLAAQVTYAIRGLNLDKNNWQQIFTGTGNITVNLPDGSSYTGPAWNSFTSALNNKADKTALGDYAKKGANSDITSIAGLTTALSIAQGGTGSKNAADARSAIGLGNAATASLQTTTYDVTTGAVLTVGAGGLLSRSSNLIDGPYNRYPSQFMRSGGGSGNVPYGAGIYASYDNNICFHLNIEGSGALRFRYLNNGLITYDYTCWHSGNTTVDTNNFIKRASPIARLTGDVSKMQPDFAVEGQHIIDGLVAVNAEAEGVSAEKKATGVYTITGAIGMSYEGWTLEVPQDINGNRLCFVEVSTEDDGSITVSVFKRRFDVDSAMIVAGEPMDIPEGRWIDLRLQMPEDSAWNIRMDSYGKEPAADNATSS